MKTMYLTVLAAFVAGIPASRADVLCPKQAVLEGAQFINHETYPTEQQIKTNFDQVFIAPGEPDFHTWDDNDLRAAASFVTLLQENERQGKIAIDIRPGGQSGCEASLGNVAVMASTDADDGSRPIDLLYFQLGGDFPDRDAAIITEGTNASVTYQIALPSNCSGCNEEAELFQFKSVTFQF